MLGNRSNVLSVNVAINQNLARRHGVKSHLGPRERGENGVGLQLPLPATKNSFLYFSRGLGPCHKGPFSQPNFPVSSAALNPTGSLTLLSFVPQKAIASLYSALDSV